jgi:hypothetical protein
MTGAYNWASMYYGGRGAEEIVSDYITGVYSTANGLVVLHQQTPGGLNPNHFWGRWYQGIDDTLDFPGGTGSMRVMPYAMMSTAVTPTVAPLTTIRAHSFNPVTANTWLDQASVVTCGDPVQLEAMSFQAGTQVLLQRVNIR